MVFYEPLSLEADLMFSFLAAEQGSGYVTQLGELQMFLTKFFPQFCDNWIKGKSKFH